MSSFSNSHAVSNANSLLSVASIEQNEGIKQSCSNSFRLANGTLYRNDNYSHPHFYMWIGLAVSSLLALLSGLDATLHCVNANEGNDGLHCSWLFRQLVAPSVLIGMLASLGSIAFLVYPRTLIGDTPEIHAKGASSTSPSQRRLRRARLFFFLGSFSLLSSLSWMRTVVLLTLVASNKYSSFDDEDFSTLGAVNAMGDVNSNANLYYSAWISLVLSLVLFYNYGSFACGTSFSKKKQHWRYSVYRLRHRMAPWIVLVGLCCVVLASSVRIWKLVVKAKEGGFYDDDDGDDDIWEVIFEQFDDLDFNDFVWRLHLAMTISVSGLILSATAGLVHWCVLFLDDTEKMWCQSFLLAFESFLVLVVFLLFLVGAGCITTYGGPAQEVGNLYYSIMGALIVSLRVGMGCLEQSLKAEDTINVCNALQATPPNKFHEPAFNMPRNQAHDRRLSHLNRWGLLSFFSFVSFVSAFNAAYSQNSISDFPHPQGYMIICPFFTCILSTTLFLSCINTNLYEKIVDDFRIGGLTAIFSFLSLMVAFAILEHSQNSLSTTPHGQILTANLYYFIWASILTAGFNMAMYMSRILSVKEKPFKLFLWLAVIKISFIMFSSALHVYLNTRDDCIQSQGNNNNTYDNYCSRTRFAMGVGLTGMILPILLLAVVSSCFDKKEGAAHAFSDSLPSLSSNAEYALAILLVFLFGFGAAIITSMGGPGQTVGDLYYSSWLVFGCSLTLLGYYSELRRRHVRELAPNLHSSNGDDWPVEEGRSVTPFVELNDVFVSTENLPRLGASV